MHMRVTIRNVFVEVVAALLVLLFLYTAISKLDTRASFVQTMRENFMIRDFAPLLSWLVPIVEIIVVFHLFIPAFRRRGLFYSFILMGIFTVYVGYMLYTQSELPCTCGGVIDRMSWRDHFWFNLIITIASLAAFIFHPKNLSRPTGEAEHLRHSRQH